MRLHTALLTHTCGNGVMLGHDILRVCLMLFFTDLADGTLSRILRGESSSDDFQIDEAAAVAAGTFAASLRVERDSASASGSRGTPIFLTNAVVVQPPRREYASPATCSA